MNHLTEDEFQLHINSITLGQWNEFFDLIPAIKRTQDFGYLPETDRHFNNISGIPEYVHSDIVTRFLKVVEKLQLVIVFDWTKWTEGSKILCDISSDYSQFDTLTLCKLLTVIIRSDRYNDGTLIICFNDGTILKICEELKNRIG